ncbi:hypothetical protein ACFE04_007753 [Oxalis oulophora]
MAGHSNPNWFDDPISCSVCEQIFTNTKALIIHLLENERSSSRGRHKFSLQPPTRALPAYPLPLPPRPQVSPLPSVGSPQPSTTMSPFCKPKQMEVPLGPLPIRALGRIGHPLPPPPNFPPRPSPNVRLSLPRPPSGNPSQPRRSFLRWQQPPQGSSLMPVLVVDDGEDEKEEASDMSNSS